MDKPTKIIDAHAHIFPAKIAEKATKSIGDFYDIEMDEYGTAEELILQGGKVGTSRYLVCSTATVPHQVQAINNFIHEECKLHSDLFFGFGSLHPAMEGFEAEINRIEELGLHGIKLHPDFQKFNIDDPVMIPIYRLLAKKNLPVLFHMGDERYDYSAPRRLREVMRQVPDLTAIAAHFGGYHQWEEARQTLKIDNVYFDTCSSLAFIPKERALELLEYFGYDRFFYGTDFPMWKPEEELERFLNLGLDPERRDMILYQNFCKLFGE